ncbi:C39 family peptidase [Hyalangium sp.]|uniref:C39 family peptidase n=1 Tax=Hyalangium sp. TaxID=2028555 RepID=UPI002D740B26|nr:C39 family peptidase [Hyalangium sp.]HYH95466.1 C39 family peptidase [Hyalangium sp.]
MTVNVRSHSEHSRASATALRPEAASKGWQPVPHINQVHPRGADQNYVNGAYNCAPTVVAMLARGHGAHSDLTDAQLISQLGQDIVTREGTDAQGVTQMLERAGVPLAGDALAANYSEADLKQHLNQGHMLIAQVRTTDRSARGQDSAHYVLIQGMTPRGNYIVSDPLSNRTYVASPKQLKEAVLKAPPDGGMLIPVASPAEAKALAAATAPAAPTVDKGLAAPRTVAANPAAKSPTLTEMPAVGSAARRATLTEMPAVGSTGARRATLTEMPAIGPAVARKPTQPEVPVDTFGAVRRPSLTEMPAVGPVAPRKPTPPELAVDAFGPTRKPSLTEMPMVGPVAPRKATLTEMPAINPSVARRVTQPELAVDTFGPVRRPSLTEVPITGPVAPKLPALAEKPIASPEPTVVAPPPADEPSEEAFTAPEEALKDVDTEFKEPTRRTRNSRMEHNERRNHYDLDVRYDRPGHQGPRSSGKKDNISREDRNENEVARELLARKARGDESVYETLAQLENSTSARDRRILDMVEQSDKKDPGTGKKMTGDGF